MEYYDELKINVWDEYGLYINMNGHKLELSYTRLVDSKGSPYENLAHLKECIVEFTECIATYEWQIRFRCVDTSNYLCSYSFSTSNKNEIINSFVDWESKLTEVQRLNPGAYRDDLLIYSAEISIQDF